jgi:hypothetical protein
MKKSPLQIFAIGLLLNTLACSNDDDQLITESEANPISQIEYFGDLADIDYPVGLNQTDNINAQILISRIIALKAYMGNNKERLSIKPWHISENVDQIMNNDTINGTNSIASFDGIHTRQISQYNGRDYFWKTDIWFLFAGVADTISQLSDKTRGHHGFLPSSVDRFYDNINWYRTNDSLVITIRRTGDYPRSDESIWINTTTKSGKFYFLNQGGYPRLADLYRWDKDGMGTYHTVDSNGMETLIDSW